MFCLDCGLTLCARTENRHSLEHWRECGHSVVLNLLDRQLWCYYCDSFIDVFDDLFGVVDGDGDDNVCDDYNNNDNDDNDNEEELLSSTTTKHDLVQASQIGQIGLCNLGNSCYINSAIQCLINTPLLTSFMLNLYEYATIADLDFCTTTTTTTTTIKSSNTKRTSPLLPLKVSYQWYRFVREYFNATTATSTSTTTTTTTTTSPITLKRITSGGALSPQKIIREMKTINPSFNGYSQQDSMDFIRLFLDRIHDECSTTTTVVKNTVNTANTTKTKSIIDDCFGGVLRSEIHCLSCNHISTKDDSFFDLSLPIAYTPLVAFSKKSMKMVENPASMEDDEDDEEQKKPSSPLPTRQPPAIIEDRQSNSLFGGIFDFMRGSPGASGSSSSSSSSSSSIDLEHCLASFCKKESLESSNRYRCEHCRTLVPSTKTLKILQAPPYLCLQLKRFKHDSYYSSKINNPVNVPMDSLDLEPFMVSDHCFDGAGAVDGFSNGNNNNNSNIIKNNNNNINKNNKNTKYRLTGMICHHGAFNGGHYVSYVRREEDDQWIECNDSHVSPVSKERVKKMQAYILFYSAIDPMAQQIRMSLVPQIRMAAAAISTKRAVPPSWKAIPITLLNTLLNHPSPSMMLGRHSLRWGLCPQHSLLRPPTLTAFDRLIRAQMAGKQNQSINLTLLLKLLSVSPHLPPSAMYCYVPEKTFLLLSDWLSDGDYGNGNGDSNGDSKDGKDDKDVKANTKTIEWCQDCLKERMKLFVRRKMECDEISRKDGPLAEGDCWYLLSSKWIMEFSRWREGRSDEPPGPIDNYCLFVNSFNGDLDAGGDTSTDDLNVDEGDDDIVSKCKNSLSNKNNRNVSNNRNLLPNLKKGVDYRGVNGEVWRYLLKQYGGGPEIQRGSIDIYSYVTVNEPLSAVDGDVDVEVEIETEN